MGKSGKGEGFRVGKRKGEKRERVGEKGNG